jgi:alginate O-acetyltransferase complex protein AlgI
VSGAFFYLAAMFGHSHATEEAHTVAFYLTPDKMFFMALGVLVSLFPVERLQGSLTNWTLSARYPLQVLALLCLVYSVAQIAANGFNPFIYFRF